jgi:hypothetical protein
MKYPSPINFIPGNAFRRASLFRRFSLWLAALSIILPALALLPAAAPVQAQEGSMVVLPDFVAQVRSLKFYPTDYGFKSFYERKYSAQFPGSSSKHINWELVLDHPFKRPGRVNFTINAVLYGPDGRKLAESANEAWIEADMNTSQHTETWGADKPGYWKPGTYRVAIQIGGKQVATGSFQIDGAGPPPPGRQAQCRGISHHRHLVRPGRQDPNHSEVHRQGTTRLGQQRSFPWIRLLQARNLAGGHLPGDSQSR